MFSLTPNQVYRLAQKSAWIAGPLTLMIPFAGYLYVGRRRLALILLAIWLPLVLMDADNELVSSMLAIVMIGAACENVAAIIRAKGALPEMHRQAEEEQRIQDLRIKLLTFAQGQGEVTLADCVIATETPPAEIQTLLRELENQDLIRSHNRLEDGAVIYRVV